MKINKTKSQTFAINKYFLDKYENASQAGIQYSVYNIYIKHTAINTCNSDVSQFLPGIFIVSNALQEVQNADKISGILILNL